MELALASAKFLLVMFEQSQEFRERMALTA